MRGRYDAVLLICALAFFIGYGFIKTTNVVAITNTVGATATSIADKDASCESAYPTLNEGRLTPIYAGVRSNGSDLMESFIHFNFSAKPSNVNSAELRVQVRAGIDQTLNFSMWMVANGWDEHAMNWLTRPVGGTLIGHLIVDPTVSTYFFNITNLTTSITELSVCINASNASRPDYGMISSREADNINDRPAIVWAYDFTVELVPGYWTGIIMAGIAAAVMLMLIKIKKNT